MPGSSPPPSLAGSDTPLVDSAGAIAILHDLEYLLVEVLADRLHAIVLGDLPGPPKSARVRPWRTPSVLPSVRQRLGIACGLPQASTRA
jgi:hypothetical protein